MVTAGLPGGGGPLPLQGPRKLQNTLSQCTPRTESSAQMGVRVVIPTRKETEALTVLGERECSLLKNFNKVLAENTMLHVTNVRELENHMQCRGNSAWGPTCADTGSDREQPAAATQLSPRVHTVPPERAKQAPGWAQHAFSRSAGQRGS